MNKYLSWREDFMLSDSVKLGEGVVGRFIKNDRFNTTLISFNFYMPLKEETVATNALLPFVLTTCSEKYPDFSKLNYKLTRLYGAELIQPADYSLFCRYKVFRLLSATDIRWRCHFAYHKFQS